MRIDVTWPPSTSNEMREEAKRRGKQPDPRSLEAANYILFLTSLPSDAFPPADILTLYRFRWQLSWPSKGSRAWPASTRSRPEATSSHEPGSTQG
jgi:hypothetical protein